MWFCWRGRFKEISIEPFYLLFQKRPDERTFLFYFILFFLPLPQPWLGIAHIALWILSSPRNGVWRTMRHCSQKEIVRYVFTLYDCNVLYTPYVWKTCQIFNKCWQVAGEMRWRYGKTEISGKHDWTELWLVQIRLQLLTKINEKIS